MPRPPSAIQPTPWRRPLMANIMQSQAVQQQLRVQGGLKQPISNPISMRSHPAQKTGADL